MWKKGIGSRRYIANKSQEKGDSRVKSSQVGVSGFDQMNLLEGNPYQGCDLGDKRLTRRAASIAECLSVKYGQPLSMVFKSASDLKRAYEFLASLKTKFEKLIEPYFQQTVKEISGLPVVLAVGDTTYLDYKKIVAKREDYGPIGNGGN
jgi:hypothetical protein